MVLNYSYDNGYTGKRLLCHTLLTFFKCVGFEVLTAVVMKSSIFWDITPCSLLKASLAYSSTLTMEAICVLRNVG
jgi:hypothetical protein